MSLAAIVKQIRQVPADCSVCQAGGAFVLLPPLVSRLTGAAANTFRPCGAISI